MVLGRLADIISAAARLSPSEGIGVACMSSGQLTESAGSHFTCSNSLRHSSSLPDFAAHHFPDDAEQGGLLNGASRKSYFLQRDDVRSSFSKEKALILQSRTPLLIRKCVEAVMILLCLLFIGFFTYLLMSFLYYYLSHGTSKFYVVLDCGSTGTRVYVYRASIDHRKGGSLPIVVKSLTEGYSPRLKGHAYDRMETEPGLHMLVHNTSGLRSAINPLLLWAKKKIPRQVHKTTSLFLYATAGVRRLPPSDSKWLLDEAWNILKQSPFMCRREGIRVISGMEEAYFGWISLNYQTDVLGSYPKKETYGALDMGGSSLQVTFENSRSFLNESNLKLRIGASNHHLSAYSLAGYGLNDAFDKSVAHIFKGIPSAALLNKTIEINHPCLHSGYKGQYLCSQCARGGVFLLLVGDPNWDGCASLAKVAVNLSQWSASCNPKPCSLPDSSVPHHHGQFYATSGFFVVYQFFNLTSESVLGEVLNKGREFCNRTWENAVMSVPPQPFVEQYCFRAPYIVSLLRDGLHISDRQIIIGSGSITWTLGVALLESGRTFSSRMKLHYYTAFKTNMHPMVLIAILIASLGFLIYALSRMGNWVPGSLKGMRLLLCGHNSASTISVLSIPHPFRFQHWSPVSSGEGRMKMPLSPTIGDGQQRQFGLEHGLQRNGIELAGSSLCSSVGSVSHSCSTNSLGQMAENSSVGAFWSPHRSQMHLQSRKSQSREDFHASLSDAAHLIKT